MHNATGSSTPQYVEQVGQRTLAAMQRRPNRLFFWKDAHSELRSHLRDFVAVVKTVDPSAYSDDQYAAMDRLLELVITAVERVLVHGVSGGDTVNCQAFGEAIRELRESREWIAQGLSPDPSRRPTDDGLRALGNDSALRALSGVVPPKQPVLPI